MATQAKGSISSEIRTGSARRDGADALSTGSLLLSFMTQASGNVKTALEKPANFKRNINHRRYLQKQLRNYSKRKGDNSTKKTSTTKFKSSQGHPGKQNYKSQNLSYMKTLRDSRLGSEKERNALKERNLPASFWQEPIIPTFQQEMGMYQYQPRPEDYSHTSEPNNDIESYLSGWNNAVAAYDNTIRSTTEFSTADAAIPSIVTPQDGVLSEEFMTGEELTRNLDIKDLYVPEMYSADRLLSDVQETLYAGQISPSQYYLPSPSPYNTDPYFNFSFEHDHQGLPPIAMAFLGQNPLAQC